MPLPPSTIPKNLLIIGLVLTFLPQPFLYFLNKSDTDVQQTESSEESIAVDQLVDQHAPSNFYIKLFLWALLTSGVICLIITFKKTLPNPEDKLFEEEWDKKGR